jgi:glutathione S-transferase
MAGVKIFGSPTSAEVARVLTCLFEKDVEFQLIRVDTYRGPKRMPEYLKLQVYIYCFHSFTIIIIFCT